MCGCPSSDIQLITSDLIAAFIEENRLELLEAKLTIAYCVMILQDLLSLLKTQLSAILIKGFPDVVWRDEFRIISVEVLKQGI